MWIIELTHQIHLAKSNYYCFNPSLIHLRDDIYILIYRVIQYDMPLEYHPWKIWDDGYKYFDNSEQVIQQKYRNAYGKGRRIQITEDKNYIDLVNEFDSTGIALFTFDGNKFQLLHNINNLFGREMNQDARITKIDSKYFISYNMFETTNNQTHIRLRYRDIQFTNEEIILSDEYPMFTHKYKSIEKNCVFDQNHNIIYGLGKTLKVIINDNMIQTPIPQLEKLINYYGEQNLFISSGTPPIKYGSNLMLAVGHIKIAYTHVGHICPFNQFLKMIDFDSIRKHGKYIYFMFFYLFDDKYNVIKLSNPFIPTVSANHLPYLLVFPAGLCYVGEKIAISYGEGDCKCKLLILNKTEIDSLLVDKLDMGFYFLTNCCRIQHYGYFNHFNCGDDAFQLIFKYLHKKFYPHFEIEFTDVCKDGYDLTTIGGGDVINKYFMSQIKSDQNVIAVGVGIPYVSEEHYLEKLKYTILRNPRDYARLKHTYKNTSYFPDLTFLLPKILKPMPTHAHTHTGKKIGMCLIQTYYKVGYETLYENFVTEIINFITLILRDGFIIHLIPFCINSKNSQENDLILMKRIKKHFPSDNVVLEYDESTCTLHNYVERTYHKIAEMDFNICSRFHSHIFSMIHHVPFVSLTCGRKCIEFMNDIELTNNLYRLKTNDKDLPIDFSGAKFYKFVKEKLKNQVNIKKKLVHFMSKYSEQMNKFEKIWPKILFKYACQTHHIKLFPKICPCENGPTSPPICDPCDPCRPSNPVNIDHGLPDNPTRINAPIPDPKPVVLKGHYVIEPKYIEKKYIKVRYVESEYVEPTYVEVRHAEPKYIEQKYVKPMYVKPTYVKSTYVKPTYVEPTYVQPTRVEPSYVQPTYVKSNYVEQSYVQPTYVKSNYMEQSYVQPTYVKPTYVEQRYVQPTYVEPIYVTEQSYINENQYVINPSYNINQNQIIELQSDSEQYIFYSQNYEMPTSPPIICKNHDVSILPSVICNPDLNKDYGMPTSPPIVQQF